MRAFTALLRRDLVLAYRQGIDAIVVILFFLAAGILFPFAVGPLPKLLGAMAPAIVLVMAALAALLALDRLFQADAEDGTLDQLALAPLPLEVAAIAKALVHWLTAGLPLMVAAPALALMLNAPASGIPRLMIALALTTPALSLLGTLGAALTLGSRRSGPLLALLVLPLFVPVLIFGAAAAPALGDGDQILFPQTILLAIDMVLLAVIPWASAAALRIAIR